MMKVKDSRLWLVAVPALCALAAFLPILWAAFLWDDALIYGNQLQFFTSWKDAFFPPPGVAFLTTAYYRPAVVLSYMADSAVAQALGYTLTSASQPIPHAVTVLGHCAATLLVGFLALRLLRGLPAARWGAFAAAVLFALHPAHADSVCLISGRTDIFATVFVLAAALLTLRHRDGGGWGNLAGAVVCVFFGLLFKEVAIVSLVLLPAVWLVAPPDPDRPARPWKPSALLGLAGFAATLAIYVGLRYASGWWLRQPFNMIQPDAVSAAISAFAFYVWKSIVPWPRHFYVLTIYPDLAPALGILAAAFAGAGLLWWRWRSERRLLTLCAFWFLASIAPVMYIAIRSVASAPIAERYLYLPSVAVCLVAGAGFARLWERERLRKAACAGLGLVAGAFALSNYVEIPVWMNEMKFWTAVSEQSCSSGHSLAWVSRGEVYRRAGRVEEALPMFQKALGPEVETNLVQSRLAAQGLGTCYLQLAVDQFNAGRISEAVTNARLAADVFAEMPMRGIDNFMAIKFVGLSLATKARTEAAMGIRNEAEITHARNSLIEAIRMRRNDAESLDALQMLEGLRK
jgi:tetratricopeptide (TPR) repeat protein